MSGFGKNIDEWSRIRAPRWLNEKVRQIVLELGNRLIYRSPVGDPQYWQSPAPPGYVGGTFRTNWLYGFNSAPGGIEESADKSGATALRAIEEGLSLVEGGGVHYLVNNLPYAQRIEDGWSGRQAPQGVVGLTELEFPQIVRDVQR